MAFEKGNKFRFQSGHVPWNRGKIDIYSYEKLKRMSDANKGKHVSPNTEFKKDQHASVSTEFKKGHKWSIDIENRRIGNVRKKITLAPDLTVDENLTYLLGLLMGDGCVSVNKYTNAHLVIFQNTSKLLVDKFSESLKKLGLNPRSYKASKSKRSFQKKDAYRVVAYSKVFHKWYSNLNPENLKTLLNTKKKIIAFIRGFYEAEGTITGNGTGTYLGFTNTNLALLNLVYNLLQKIGFEFNLNGPYRPKLGKKAFYRLGTSKRKQIENFIKIIEPHIKKEKNNGV